tara:strand:+ start:132 stop:1157 length:1026 start_codon:yes stop_codon:yes gene_type:complete
MWAGSPLENAIQPRRIVVQNKEKYSDFVKAHNGRMNVYTSVYDYEEFSKDRGLEHTVVIDRLFLDIDAHGDESLDEAWNDMKVLHKWLTVNGYKHNMAFSGRGFYIFVYGKRTFDLRRVKAFFNICQDVCGKSPRLDNRVINTARLRRTQNSYHLGAKLFSINLVRSDLNEELSVITNLAKKPRKQSPVWYGETLVEWPQVKEMEASEIEIDYVESPGDLPILPCLKAAVMTHNPLHESRHYLVQWYNEFLSDLTVVEKDLNCKPREIGGDALVDIISIITGEIKKIASNEDVWIDYDERKTRSGVSYVVNKRYMAPSCQTLISKAYCLGKCWRYPQGALE